MQEEADEAGDDVPDASMSEEDLAAQAEADRVAAEKAAAEAQAARVAEAEERSARQAQSAAMTPPPKAEPASAALRVNVVGIPGEEGPRPMSLVVPLRDIRKIRIGKGWYTFGRGKKCKVPTEIVPHLREKGIV